jgi:NADPH:quinone reductase-like Zn-dependent oxidoreductase
VTLTGYSTEALTGPALREAVRRLAELLETGQIEPPEYHTLSLAEAARAHLLLEQRHVRGRVLLQP